jgi:hypothetical protein
MACPPATEQFTLTINIEPDQNAGSVTINPDKEKYNLNEEVTITAVPESGYNFESWSGDYTGSDNPLTITMDSNKNLTANFGEGNIKYTLTVVVSPDDSYGSVTVNPNQTNYDEGTQVTLTANSQPGYEFVNWTEGATVLSSNGILNITMNENRTITANFQEETVSTYTLTVNINPNNSYGNVLINPDLPEYTNGTQVTLTAVPETGYLFTNWSGAFSGSTNPITITMDSNKSITATFQVQSTGGITISDEDWETGSITQYYWVVGGNVSPSVNTSQNHTTSGSYSMQFGTIGDSQISWFGSIIEVSQESDISFYYKTSCETLDKVNFYIDEINVFSYGGEKDWTQAGPFTLPVGTYAIRWEYKKDHSDSQGSDTGWIDDITFGSDAVSLSARPILGLIYEQQRYNQGSINLGRIANTSTTTLYFYIVNYGLSDLILTEPVLDLGTGEFSIEFPPDSLNVGILAEDPSNNVSNFSLKANSPANGTYSQSLEINNTSSFLLNYIVEDPTPDIAVEDASGNVYDTVNKVQVTSVANSGTVKLINLRVTNPGTSAVTLTGTPPITTVSGDSQITINTQPDVSYSADIIGGSYKEFVAKFVSNGTVGISEKTFSIPNSTGTPYQFTISVDAQPNPLYQDFQEYSVVDFSNLPLISPWTEGISTTNPSPSITDVSVYKEYGNSNKYAIIMGNDYGFFQQYTGYAWMQIPANIITPGKITFDYKLDYFGSSTDYQTTLEVWKDQDSSTIATATNPDLVLTEADKVDNNYHTVEIIITQSDIDALGGNPFRVTFKASKTDNTKYSVPISLDNIEFIAD